MDPVIAAALGRAGGMVAGKLVVQGIPAKIQKVRVARASAKEAGKHGISISPRSIRQWLEREDTGAQLRLGPTESLESVLQNLAWTTGGTTDAERTANAEQLLYIILHQYLRTVAPKDATQLSHEWQSRQLQRESQAIQMRIAASEDSILDRTNASRTFENTLQSFPPWRRKSAETIRGQWPRIEQIVDSLANINERNLVLRQWSQDNPDWFADAPPTAWCWLGSVSSDVGEQSAAETFYVKAIDAGAYPRAYWVARRAMLHAEYAEDAAKSLLEAEASGHPLGNTLLAILRKDYTEALGILEGWESENDDDTALKGILQARLKATTDNLSGAISTAEQTGDATSSAGAYTTAARLLLSRAVHERTISRLTDAQRALRLALKARDLRRSWGPNSAEAAVVALQAAHISGDPERAWKISQPHPEGEATETEARDETLRGEAALTAALTGRSNRAHELLADIDDPFTQAHVQAILADDSEDPTSSAAKWQACWSVASKTEQRLLAAMGLAEAGADLPDLSDLAEESPQAVEEIRAVAQVMSEGGIESLRANAHQSPLLTLKLANRYAADGNLPESAEALKAGAERWSHPTLMIMAARRFHEGGSGSSARQAAEASLSLGGPAWSGATEARFLLLQISADEGRWDLATQEAISLVMANPNDADSNWALVKCLIARGDIDGAWKALTSNGDPIRPRTEEEAMRWISLCARYSTDPHFTGKALAVMQGWPDSEDLVGVFIGQIYTGLRRDDLTPGTDDLTALHEATYAYIQRYPESRVFRSVAVDDDNLLAPFEEGLRQQHERLEDLVKQVERGSVPIGLLSSATDRPYAEMSLRRGAGVVYAHNPGSAQVEISTIESASGQRVVMDTTAAHTLALLDPSLADTLIGYFSSIKVPDPCFKDALRARDWLSERSTLSVVWDSVRQSAAVHITSDEEAESIAERATQLVGILKRFPRFPWPQLKHFPDFPDDSDLWLCSLDSARDSGAAFWCDDLVLRGLATSVEVPTFGTVALIDHLRQRDFVSHSEAEIALIALVRARYVDLGFSSEVMSLAAAADRWRPLGVASAISRIGAWSDPEAVVALALRALAESSGRSADDVSGWAYAVTKGLVTIAPSSDAASDNVLVLLNRVFSQAWLGPTQVKAVLDGVRAGMATRDGIADPVPKLLGQIYAAMIEKHGHMTASQLLMSLFSAADDPDRSTAARTVLLHDPPRG